LKDFDQILDSKSYDVIWRCMTLYDVVWCCMMFYDAVWCCMMLYDFVGSSTQNGRRPHPNWNLTQNGRRPYQKCLFQRIRVLHIFALRDFLLSLFQIKIKWFSPFHLSFSFQTSILIIQSVATDTSAPPNYKKDGNRNFPPDIEFPVNARVIVKFYKVVGTDDDDGKVVKTKYLNTMSLRLKLVWTSRICTASLC